MSRHIACFCVMFVHPLITSGCADEPASDCVSAVQQHIRDENLPDVLNEHLRLATDMPPVMGPGANIFADSYCFVERPSDHWRDHFIVREAPRYTAARLIADSMKVDGLPYSAVGYDELKSIYATPSPLGDVWVFAYERMMGRTNLYVSAYYYDERLEKFERIESHRVGVPSMREYEIDYSESGHVLTVEVRGIDTDHGTVVFQLAN